MRIDRLKMFLLAATALAITQLGRSPRILPAWLAPLGFVLAAALVTSGVGYLLLDPGLSSAVYASGILLLIFVSATGITLRRYGEHGARARAVRISSGVGIICPRGPLVSRPGEHWSARAAGSLARSCAQGCQVSLHLGARRLGNDAPANYL